MFGGTVKEAVDKAMAKVRLAFRAVGGVTDLQRKLQLVDGEGMAGEQLTKLELFQHFGFTSALPENTQLLVVPLGGRTSHAVVVASEHTALRFVLNEVGEVAVYNQWGDVVHLRQDRTIHLKAEVKVLVETPLAQFTGNVHVQGNVDCDNTVTATSDCIGGGVSLKNHTHGGVQGGGGHTLKPD